MITEQKQLFCDSNQPEEERAETKELPYDQQILDLKNAPFDSYIRLTGKRLANVVTTPDDSTDKSSDVLYESMDRGRAILQTEEQLDKYMHAFGRKHYLKFMTLFKSVPASIFAGFFDIVDWGAGCGLGIIALNDYCRKTLGRDIESCLRKVILIEPSDVAIKRAHVHTRLLFPESESFLICKSFEQLTIEDFPPSALGVPRIHLFSNVLDLDIFRQTLVRDSFFGLVKNTFRRNEFFLCVSPTYNRIKDVFEDLFRALSDDDVTERTIYGPEEKVFTKENDGRDVKMTGMAKEITSQKATLRLGQIKHRQLLDEMNGRRDSSNSQRKLVQQISMQCSPEEVDILYRPYLMGMKPDMLILKKRHKALLIYSCDAHCESEECLDSIISLCGIVEGVKQRLYGLLSRELREANNKDNRNYGLIVCSIFLPNMTITDAELRAMIEKHINKKSKEREDQGMQQITRKKPDIQHIRFHAGDLALKWSYASQMTDSLYNDLKNLLVPQIASNPDGKIDFRKDKKQLELIVSRAGKQQKVSGAFGAGKTAVLAERACSAFRRTHQPVLILTYNITLRSYIERMLYRQYGAFNRNQFCVVNYHEFINGECLSIGHKVKDVSRYDGIGFFKQQRDMFSKFQTILIDEAQDYKYEWFNIIRDTFLADNGEYVLFGDEKQNIYGKTLDIDRKIKTNIPGIPNTMSATYRSNPTVTARLNEFQRLMFRLKYDTEEIESRVHDLFVGQSGLIDVYNVNRRGVDQVVDSIIAIHEKHGLPYSKIVLLGSSQSLLRHCDKHYRDRTGLDTECMFISHEDYCDLRDQLREDRDNRINIEIRSRERSMKLHFDATRDVMKMSTIYSFKGFEEDSVILIIQPQPEGKEDTELELIYTGLTRAKRNLFIINYGDTRYGKDLSRIFSKSPCVQ